MPIYEFLCQSCEHEFEQILPFSAQSTPHCPQCKSNQVARQVGRPAIHFKGSGWYINDSKRGKDSANGSETKATDKTPSSTESSPSTADTTPKSETKSDAKESRASVDSTN
jgi:putative FmdB family regulatory protein